MPNPRSRWKPRTVPIEERLSPADLHEMFDLQDDGTLIWKRRRGDSFGDKVFNGQFPGKVAGSTKGTRDYVHVRISFDCELYLVKAHRIVIAMVDREWPPRDSSVDHIDGRNANNRRSNLRVCSQMGNMKNQNISKNNQSGFKGVNYHRRVGAWIARIGVENKRLHLGCYPTAEDAAHAYDAAAVEHHGQFARTNASMGLL